MPPQIANTASNTSSNTSSNTASRLHHSAAVVSDLGASRVFYEYIMGLPLLATWCESNDSLGDFCHAFFGLGDQSAVALFQFASEDVYQKLKKPHELSAFHHLALTGTSELQENIRVRAQAAGVPNYTTDNGYCVSLYLDDPDGHKVEITVDTEDALELSQLIQERAGAELERWLAGDHKTNNILRGAADL